METYVDQDYRGYRPVAIMNEEEYANLSRSTKATAGGYIFILNHWTKETGSDWEILDRVYIKARKGRRSFDCGYAHRFYSHNAGKVLCSLQVGHTTKQVAEALIAALISAI